MWRFQHIGIANRLGSLSNRAITRRMTQAPATTHPDVAFVDDAVTEAEAEILLRDCDKRLATRKYQGSHFDSVIQDYKETEMPFKFWSAESLTVIKRLFALAFKEAGLPANTPFLSPHVIDLKPTTGIIYPHVDSLKHGGEIVAALSLISTRNMRLTQPPKDYEVGKRMKVDNNTASSPMNNVEYQLKPRSFYVLTKAARYDLAHEISAGETRRVSIVFRDQPKDFMPDWAKEFMGSGGMGSVGSAPPT